MRGWVILVILSVFSYNFPYTDTCVLPTDLRGTWIDTFKGALEIEDSRITGYEFHTFGTLTLTCYQQDDNLYIMESTPFLFYGLNFTAYFCWNFTQVNTDMFFFYEYAAPVADAGNERAKVYLPNLPRIYNSICVNPDVGLGTYRIMFRNGTIEDAITDCPPQINGNYKYDVKDDTGSSTCNSSSNPLDACTNSTALQYNGTDCSIPLAYSDSGSVFCLFNVQDSVNKIHYMSLYNPGEIDESSTFSITCMIMNYASSSLKATQYPRQCPDDMNTTYVTSPGAYVYLNSPSSCYPTPNPTISDNGNDPTPNPTISDNGNASGSEFPWWIIGVGVGIFFLIVAIIVFFLWRKKKKEEDKKKHRLLQGDDGRFDPEKKRDKDGKIIPDEPPKIKRPKSEGGMRRLDKRKRVWVVGKDGEAKKFWKEAGESPDSGMGDDEVDGGGGGGKGHSAGRKMMSTSGRREKEDDDMSFAKKHGRKELKSAREIEDKGEKDRNSAKLMRKMKGMVSAKKSSRLRKSARSGTKTGRKSAPYKDDDDGERSWGSDTGEYEEVDVEKIPELDDNTVNEIREKLGNDFVQPVAAVAVVSETDSKEGGKGKKGKRDKGKHKAEKGGPKEKEESEEKQGEEPSVSGVPATAVVVDETAEGKKKEKETSKKTQTNKKSQKKVESKQTKKASDKKLPSGKQEHIEMQDKKAVSFREGGDDGKLSGGEKAAIGAGTAVGGAVAAAVAVLTKDSEKEKTEAELKAEQKKKDKEEAKRHKEEKKRMEKEAKEAKKNADADAKEKAKALTRYASVDESKNENAKAETKDEESIFSEKKDDPKPAGNEPAAIGASTAVGGAVAAAAVVAKNSEKEKTEAELKAEQKKKDKEEAKRQKEEKKRLDKEAKIAKKKSEADAKEKSPALTKYTSIDESKGGNKKVENKDKEIIPSEKKEDLKQSDDDSGHVTPTSADNLSKPNSSRQEADKTLGDATDEKPPPPPLPPREPTLSSSLRPRREQSVLLELDNSRSGSAGITGEKGDSNTSSKSQAQKTMEVVDELVDTARSKAEGLDNTLDESIAVAPVVVPLLDLDSINETVKADSARGDGETEDKKGKENDIEDEKRKTSGKEKQKEKSKTGAKTTDKQKDTPSQGVQIRVTEADVILKPHHETIQEEDGESGNSDDSSEPDVPTARRKKPQGFMFADPSGANNAFKKAGDILHTMPVKKKVAKRKPRAAPVDIATTLPKRTSAAFDTSNTQKGKRTTASKTITAKAIHPTAPKGPMTIKDITKKPPTEQAGRSPRRDPVVEGADTSSKSGQSSHRDSKDRKTSEIEHGHLQLMTKLMSMADGDEGQESATPSREQSEKARQSRLDKAEMSARARAEEAALVDGEPSESMDTPDALLTARQGPILHGRPPTHHAYSRASSAGTRARSGISRSHSDSRQAWLPPNQDTTRTRNTHSSTSTTSEERFVRFKQGVMKQLRAIDQQDMDAIMYPRVNRYPEDASGGPTRTNPAYRSMGTLQRIHRKNNKVGPLRPELPPIQGSHWPRFDNNDDPDDPRMKMLLEELYKDKKYMDKTLRDNKVENEFVRSRTLEGRSFLLNRARFWSTQQPLVRPGTQSASRSSTAMPPFPGEGNDRTRSEERPGERLKD